MWQYMQLAREHEYIKIYFALLFILAALWSTPKFIYSDTHTHTHAHTYAQRSLSFSSSLSLSLSLSLYFSLSLILCILYMLRISGPDMSSKNDRKTQINIEICDFFPSQKVCVCGVGGGGGGEYQTCPPCPPPNDAHGP